MPKRILSGTICKATNKKTVVVEVERTFKHPIYKKYIKRSKKYHAHDETDALRVGDKVMIEETRPISKLKTWKVVNNEKRS
ncbi:MAG: 30S ribosomal protein S17 [Alphaproteobacteria bacterium]|jgi:small subunit ribosomal protein S17|nr:MAG: 30S ribosomal protein S17 [Alphaproteobacteria bacterium]